MVMVVKPVTPVLGRRARSGSFGGCFFLDTLQDFSEIFSFFEIVIFVFLSTGTFFIILYFSCESFF